MYTCYHTLDIRVHARCDLDSAICRLLAEAGPSGLYLKVIACKTGFAITRIQARCNALTKAGILKRSDRINRARFCLAIDAAEDVNYPASNRC